jgi:hypothetical protein
MYGLRLYSQCFGVKTTLGIRAIVDFLAPEISQLYCVIHGDYLMRSSVGKEEAERFDRDYNLFLMEELGLENNDLKLFRPGFLQKFRDCLYGDWTRFYLLKATVPLSTIRPWSNELPAECEILICCVDAAYWEIFVNNPELFGRPREAFAEAVSCRLDDKNI